MKKAVITRYEFTVGRGLREPIRIAHVSDLHERRAEDILGLLKESKPDIIVVTGDTYERYDDRPQYDLENRPIKTAIIKTLHFINHLMYMLDTDDQRVRTANADAFLKEAVRIAPVYMSLGNHEQKLLDRDLRFVEREGICLLDNACVKARIKGFDMLIGGMSTWDFDGFLDLFSRESGFKLLLCHNPERFEPFLKDTDIDLVLSGHTHGGQIRIGKKGRGFFVPGQSLFGRYAHGSFFGGRLIVSAGCSNTVAMPRMFNPRELVIVDLKG